MIRQFMTADPNVCEMRIVDSDSYELVDLITGGQTLRDRWEFNREPWQYIHGVFQAKDGHAEIRLILVSFMKAVGGYESALKVSDIIEQFGSDGMKQFLEKAREWKNTQEVANGKPKEN